MCAIPTFLYGKVILDTDVIRDTSAELAAVIDLRIKLGNALKVVKLDLPGDGWDDRAAFGTVLSLEARRRGDFPTGYAVVPTVSVCAFASELQKKVGETALKRLRNVVTMVEEITPKFADMLESTLKGAQQEIHEFLSSSVGPGVLAKLPLAINFQEDMLEDGDTIPASLVSNLANAKCADMVKELDTIKGVMKVLQEIDPEANWPSVQAFSAMGVALPALIAMAKCQKVECVVPQFATTPPDDEDERKKFEQQVLESKLPSYETIEKFLIAFAEVTRECKAVKSEEGIKTFEAKAKKWVSRNTVDLVTLTQIASAKMLKMSSELDRYTFVAKPLLKNFDANLETFMNFDNRERIKNLIKSLNGDEGEGIKLCQRLEQTLRGTEANCDALEKDIKQAREVRQKARSMIIYRSVAMLIKKNTAPDKKFYQQCGLMGVTLDAKIKERLDKLK